MKTITIILPNDFDEVVIVTTVSNTPNGAKITTRGFKVENGLVIDFEKAKIDSNGKVIGNEV